MKIGFIGLGAMGLPISGRLIKANYELYVYDISEKAMETAVSNGAVKCPNVADLAKKAEVLFCSLPNANIIQNVLNDISGAEDVAVRIVADLSSVAPESSQSFAKQMSGRGIAYIDCPISGGVSGAAAGTLTIMAGGDGKTIEGMMPIFQAIGKNIYHVGGVGAGSSIKMINNYIMGCTMATVAEALVLGAKLGIDLNNIYEIVKVSSGRNFIIENKIPNFIMKRQFEGGFAVDLEYKDMGLFLDSAKNQKMPTPMGSMAMQVFEMARAKGYGKQDITSLIKVWEELMNVEVS